MANDSIKKMTFKSKIRTSSGLTIDRHCENKDNFKLIIKDMWDREVNSRQK